MPPITITTMKKLNQKIKEFKRKSLKNLQAKLRNFLSTEFRTPEEIQKDKMDACVKSLKEIGPEYSLDYMSGYVGEVTYMQDKTGNTYYKNHITGNWISVNNDEEISDKELKSILEN